MGYTPTVVATVWFGYDVPRAIAAERLRRPARRPGVGGLLPNGWTERAPASAWEPPVGLVSRTIDAETGDIANEWCPTKQTRVVQAGHRAGPRSAPATMAPLIRRLEEFGRALGEAIGDLLGL